MTINTKSGYSLIELVMVVGLVSLLALTATALLLTSLSGTGKAGQKQSSSGQS